jgi:hypothetical protein
VFLHCPYRGVIKGQRRSFEFVVVELSFSFRDASLPGYELGSRGIELSRMFGIGGCRIMARKGIRRCKEDFMCDLKLR